MENSLPHIFNYKNTIFEKKKRSAHNIFYVRKYFCVISSTLNDILEAQNKTNH